MSNEMNDGVLTNLLANVVTNAAFERTGLPDHTAELARSFRQFSVWMNRAAVRVEANRKRTFPVAMDECDKVKMQAYVAIREAVQETPKNERI